MRPQTLTICAWGPYPNLEQVDFTRFQERGIFLITGATGAGKTTIFDAITYALYGSLSGEERDRERSSVRSDFASPQTPTYVELVMEHSGKCYQIRRNPEYQRPKKRGGAAAFTREKENAILTYPDGRVLEGVREVNAAMQELLVLDYQQFKKISMIAQGEFAKLLVASPKDKTRIFREIFGTGVCERFTHQLGKRSRELYQKVTEQKHKLEEDIRLLLESLDKNNLVATDGMEQESEGEALYRRLQELVEAEYWNETELLECLEGLEALTTGYSREQKAQYRKLDGQVEKQTALLSSQMQDNLQIERLETALAEQERLAEQSIFCGEKEKRYQQALNAGFVEGSEEKRRQIMEQLAGNQREQEREQHTRLILKQEQESLAEIMKLSEHLREQIGQKKLLLEKQAEWEQLQKKLTQRRGQLQQLQQSYLKDEEEFINLRQRYEEKEQQRRLSAVGLAASMLREGEPCPVCGSTIHPHPAEETGEEVSEEVLEALKNKLDEKEEDHKGIHEQVVTLRTQVQGMKEQLLQVQRQMEELEQAFREEQSPLQKEYLSLEPGEAVARLKAKSDRANSLTGLLEEKSRQQKRLAEQEEQLSEALSQAEEEWRHALVQYGFEEEESYLQAKCPKQERERLELEISEYRNRVAANTELCIHLKETVGEKQKADLGQLRQRLQEEKKLREEALKEQKKWEHCQKDIHRTLRLLQEKQSILEQYREEYGYVKDLENLASGNNSRRLVFEQYVLASYFEEILRAANLRLRQMTSGRYEMSRISEVGDGRVKDSLEIQVLDYYTGKYRSVRTLSGGESFKASLSLALGMSDVIQAMNGGIRVDALFIDEGFGALDAESLDQACDTLVSLAEKNRLIGIISHVPELRERIGQQLMIEKSNSGSRIRNSV